MKRIAFFLISVATIGGVVAFSATASRHSDQVAAPIFVTEIPPGYRDWKFISVAHEEGNLNKLRVHFGQRHRDQGLPGGNAAISGRRHHCRTALPLRSICGEQQSFWP